MMGILNIVCSIIKGDINMEEKIDMEAIVACCSEIRDRVKLIGTIFPKDKEFLLNHLAAAQIHIALFMKDLYGYLTDQSENFPEELRFLENCGCKDFLDKK